MAQPGWYPDPRDPSVIRWWDGTAWTDHIQPGAAPLAPPPAVASPPSAAAAHLGALEAHIRAATDRLAHLRQELVGVEEALEIQSFGFYRPRYGFRAAYEYEARLEVIREEQKDLIRAGQATRCDRPWTVDGSVAEGKKMLNRQAKLMLRAFNGECDAAIAKVRYDNAVVLQGRISKACNEINKLGESTFLYITERYHDLKVAELQLVHEHREKLQEEKEEQKRVREEMKEEKRAAEEAERAQAAAERDEEKHREALEKAQADLASKKLTAAQHAKLEALIVRLENELKDAIEVKAKAVARARLTRSGHVYVLSNEGSFGEGVYKIGLTRRLDPYERVDELGDASVPFPFDVHAIIFAEDAPALEHKLHVEFASRRVNAVNPRKEYFRVALPEIIAAVKRHHGLVSFVVEAEAEEWRKTQAMLGGTVPAEEIQYVEAELDESE